MVRTSIDFLGCESTVSRAGIGGGRVVGEAHELSHWGGEGAVGIDGDGARSADTLFDDETRFQEAVHLAHNGGLIYVDRSSQIREGARAARRKEQLYQEFLLGLGSQYRKDILHLAQYILHETQSKEYGTSKDAGLDLM